jgi:thymidylate synthase (FAD)
MVALAPAYRRVLDAGFVMVVATMGDDSSIVQAARVSYGVGLKTPEEDKKLIFYLMEHRHTSPFEMCEIKLHVKVPMDCWRQWTRHRTANISEVSTRYTELTNQDFQKTDPSRWRKQSTKNKQGSEDFLPVEVGSSLSRAEVEFHVAAFQLYRERIEAGVAREQARKDLPLCTYTEAYWKIDLHNLLHFLELRMHPSAQYEIRQYANVIGEIVAAWCPITWEAFKKYRLLEEA